jgi:hypothetical protein
MYPNTQSHLLQPFSILLNCTENHKNIRILSHSYCKSYSILLNCAEHYNMAARSPRTNFIHTFAIVPASDNRIHKGTETNSSLKNLNFSASTSESSVAAQPSILSRNFRTLMGTHSPFPRCGVTIGCN